MCTSKHVREYYSIYAIYLCNIYANIYANSIYANIYANTVNPISLTTIMFNFFAPVGMLTSIKLNDLLASLPLLIQYTDNFVVSCSGRGISLNPG